MKLLFPGPSVSQALLGPARFSLASAIESTPEEYAGRASLPRERIFRLRADYCNTSEPPATNSRPGHLPEFVRMTRRGSARPASRSLRDNPGKFVRRNAAGSRFP